jgi:predicted metal-binding transcription factor (methanogenesis marker protein 9)
MSTKKRIQKTSQQCCPDITTCLPSFIFKTIDIDGGSYIFLKNTFRTKKEKETGNGTSDFLFGKLCLKASTPTANTSLVVCHTEIQIPI